MQGMREVMDLKWDYKLKPDQRSNPVVYAIEIKLPDSFCNYPESDLLKIFPENKHSLKTWGDTLGVSTDKPHWIGVRKPTSLHTDPKYSRYTHHLMVKADNVSLRGMDKVETQVNRGQFLILDTHSPHQLIANDKKSQWYLAISMDSAEIIIPSIAIPQLMAYGNKASLLNEEIIKPNNGGRYAK
jgi:hypothetical protein